MSCPQIDLLTSISNDLNRNSQPYNKCILMNSSTHSATLATGGVNSVAIGVSIAAVVLVLTGVVVVILIACVVWKYRRSRKTFLPVSSLLVIFHVVCSFACV